MLFGETVYTRLLSAVCSPFTPPEATQFFVLQYLFPGLNYYLFMDFLSMNLSNCFSNLLLLPLEASFRTP